MDFFKIYFTDKIYDKWKFGGSLMYFVWYLTDVWTNFLHYPLTFNSAKLYVLKLLCYVHVCVITLELLHLRYYVLCSTDILTMTIFDRYFNITPNL